MKKTEAHTKFCKAQIMRLQVTGFFDRLDVIGRSELSKTLMAAAESEAQAEMVINCWLAEKTEFPKPAEIWAMARRMNSQPKPALVSCDQCGLYPGYVFIERVIQSGLSEGVTERAMMACSCPLGRAIAASFKELKAEEKKTSPDFRPATPAEAEAAALTEIFPIDPKEPIQ